MIKHVEGNIFNFITEGAYLVHQTNTEGVMGGGIAYQIKNIFPNVFKEYAKYCRQDKNNVMGSCQIVPDTYKSMSVNICNCFAQDLSTLHDGHLTDYIALRLSLNFLSVKVPNNATILIPKNIGCGIGGGDWNVVEDIISETLGHHDVLIVDFNGDKLV